MKRESKTRAPMSLCVAFYENRAAAKSALDVLKRMDRERTVKILDAAIMACDDRSDRLVITESAEVTAKKGAMRGAIAGGLLALVFPPSILALGLTGAAIGAAFGHFTDQGFSNNLLQEVAENLPPGGAALLAMVEELWVNTVSSAISGYDDLRLYRLEAEAAEYLTSRAS